jgi:hypothetical protein
MNFLVVHVPALAPQMNVHAPIAIAHAGLADLLYAGLQRSLPGPAGAVLAGNGGAKLCQGSGVMVALRAE